MSKVAIYGGLGNQMFQYALHVKRREAGLPSDIFLGEFFYLTHHNGFSLKDAFRLNLSPAAKLNAMFLAHGGPLYKTRAGKAFFSRWMQRIRTDKKNVFREKKEFSFDPEVLHSTQKFLFGTWQALDYLKDIGEPLRREFEFNPPADDLNKQLEEKIRRSESVSIHIRRGDYISPEWAKTHAVIKDIGYYLRAVDFIRAHVANPEFFIFSDDIQWAVDNLPLERSTYIDHNKGKNSYLDMYLMSLCKHNIIANSTFSWWAAWLNNNKDKYVLIPEKWLNGCDCSSLYVGDWIKIPV